MAEARSCQLWDHTAEVLALLANGLCRGRGDRPFLARHFHPHVLRRLPPRDLSPAEKKDSFAVLRAVFCGPSKN